MDHITFLRRYVGHAPLLMVGATVLLIDEQDRLLLMKRSDNDCWAPPGGAVEPGEVVEEAARREVREETGIEMGEVFLFGVFSGPELFYRYPNGDEVYIITVVYLARHNDGEIRLNDEHTNWGWFAASDIPQDVGSPIRPIIEQFIQSSSRQ